MHQPGKVEAATTTPARHAVSSPARPSLVDLLQKHVKSFSEDAQIVGKLLRAMQEAPERGRPSHLFLKDLVNLQAAYWEHIGHLPQHGESVRRAFHFGTQMHLRAEAAFADLPDFCGVEATLDGAAMGVAGVRGKIDFRLEDGLLEFKTTSHTIETPQDVWANVPQDIEQLLFYGAIWTLETPIHYLAFLTEAAENPLRVFRAQITNLQGVRATMIQRRDRLFKAIEEKNPSHLWQCRYYRGDCWVRNEGLCSCSSLNGPGTQGLEGMVQLERDTKREEQMNNAWKSLRTETRSVSAWDLVAPRKAYMRLTGTQSDWTPPEPSKARRALSSSGLLPEVSQRPKRKSLEGKLPLIPKGTLYVVRTVSRGRQAVDQVLPALFKEWRNDRMPTQAALRNHLMQLGVLCAVEETSVGVLILDAPMTPSKVFAYVVEYKELDGIRREIRIRAAEIHDAVEAEEPSRLALCPTWLKSDCTNCLCDRPEAP